jgi:ComF family protein
LPYTEFASKAEGDYYDFCIAPLYYRDVVRKALLQFKFKNAPIYADALGRMLAEIIKEHPDLWIPDSSPRRSVYDIITWVPLSVKRKRSRGYDQALLLAMATALKLDDVAVEILRKPIDVQPQSDLGGEAERRANIDGAFEIVDPDLVEGKCILLIDDIVTTGSTLSECAKVLLDAGASRVICATIAMKN